MVRAFSACLLAGALASGCDRTPPSDALADAGDLDAGDLEAGDLDAADLDAAPDVDAAPPPHCPPDMVLVKDRFCVDRYEMSLVDADTDRPLSPYYPPLKKYGKYIENRHAEAERLLVDAPDGKAASTPFPQLSDWQLQGKYKAKAASRRGAIPSAYLTMAAARDACIEAGKRLCSLEEWQTACRGQEGRQFPYGDTYKRGVCNVFREGHPGHVLFGNVTVGMLDPRMNKISLKGKPLLRETGGTPECKSAWGDDAIYDMVGNLDEWIDDPEGTFAGGFFSRTATTGCDRLVTAHTATYFDYSTGGRCCAAPSGEQ